VRDGKAKKLNDKVVSVVAVDVATEDMPLSRDEETRIISYIIDNDYAAEVNGMAVWKLIW
jgi:hypothetical protein